MVGGANPFSVFKCAKCKMSSKVTDILIKTLFLINLCVKRTTIIRFLNVK